MTSPERSAAGSTARTASVRARLRTQPAYAADCFTVCTAHPRGPHLDGCA
ncbi:hypothetical protein OHA57_30765 [Streptomyces anulatus]|nr:hypothetical protein [Streptomyces anulatus]WSC64876.1 hypothetical protein OHA57_30765 [Streptomyces anulatus]WTC62386.1 hypothetical protein OG865_07560 [Streptomyces anulatus]WUC85885.1 hypothetical protein OHQ35_07270 [Streptomyces anulatus]